MFFRRSAHPKENDLSAYIDNALDVAETRRIAAHIESCTQCREAVEGLRETKAFMAALPRYEAPRSFALSASQAGVQAAKPAAARPGALRFAPALSLAVLAILIVVDIASPGTRTSSNASHTGLVAKSRAESVDSAAGKTLEAPNASTAQAPRAAGADAGVPGSSAPSAGAAVVPPTSGGAPSILSAPVVPIAPVPQPGTSGSPPIQSFSAPVAPGVPVPAPAPSSPPIVLSPPAIQSFSAQNGGTTGSTPQAAGGAGSSSTANPVAPVAPQPGAFVPVLPSPPPDTPITLVTKTHTDRTLLRVLEVLAAAAFMASLFVVFWPRLTGKGRYS